MLFELKFLAPTNHRGTRIKAISNQASITIPWDYSLSDEANYRQAAQDLSLHIAKLNKEPRKPSQVELFYLKDKIFSLVKELN